MPAIEISEDLYKRIEQFPIVINAVLEEEPDMDSCIAMVIDRGLRSMLCEVLSQVEGDILLESFCQLAAREPAAVYRYVADTLNRGTQVNKEALRSRIGFKA